MHIINELLQLAGCELLSEEELNETKPARYLSHLDKSQSFANLTAERNNPLYEPVEGDSPSIAAYKTKMQQKQSAENNRRIEELKSDLRSMGLSFIKTHGRWNEGGKQTNEQSFLVPNITKEQALKLGKKYNQYSIIFKERGDDTAYMYITLDNDNFGKPDMQFDMSNQNKFVQVKEPSEREKKRTSASLRDYSGATGFKKGGHGYQLKYIEK